MATKKANKVTAEQILLAHLWIVKYYSTGLRWMYKTPKGLKKKN